MRNRTAPLINKNGWLIWLVSVWLAGCGGQQAREPATHPVSDAQIRSILVVPVVNQSVEVNAPDYFLSTITKPLAERGYYVFPVHMVKRVMEDDGLSDSYMVHQADTARLAKLFGADAVLYVVINRWDARYMVLSTQVTVEFTYTLKEGASGDTLWQNTQRRSYSPDANGSSHSDNVAAELIVAVITAAATKAAPNYLPLTRQANEHAITEAAQGLPKGPYLLEIEKKKQDR